LSSKQANFDGRYPAGSASKGDNLQKPTDVGSYLPNPLGIYDLHGNVYEWTDSLWKPGGSGRVIRGGCWDYLAVFCTASYRDWLEPDDWYNFLGFRLLAVPQEG
jgi:formylglycine-generating enzyme required for sulfatase activity